MSDNSTPPLNKPEHDIHSFLWAAQSDLQREYERIRKRSAEDPGTAGDQGEENWAELLRDWLPRYFQVVTKGRIITHTGYTSPQMDVLVLAPTYPRVLLQKKHYLSAGVAAAFECKTTLKSAHIKKAVRTAAQLKAALPRRVGTPYKELHAGIIYGLLAHSHSWKAKASRPRDNVSNALLEADAEHVRHPRECLDLLTVSDLATWQMSKMNHVNVQFAKPEGDGYSLTEPASCVGTAYLCHAIGWMHQTEDFTPVGAMLSRLFSALAWTYRDMRDLDQYFRGVRLQGSGLGQARIWDIDVYSDSILEAMDNGTLPDKMPYDEWSMML